MPSGSVGSIVFLIFTAAVTLAVLLQLIILIVMAVAARKLQRQVTEQIDQIREDVAPALRVANDLLQESAPKIKSIASNLHVASERLRGQVDRIDNAVEEVTGRTRKQVVRIDGMVSTTLDAIAHGTRTIQENVLAPIRQVGGWLTTIGAALDILRRPERRGRGYDDPRN